MFPSLQASAAAKSSKATNSPKTNHKLTHQTPTSNDNSSWPSLASYRQTEELPRVPLSYSNATRTPEVIIYQIKLYYLGE